MNSMINVVDLFCGAGGLSLGFQKAGFNMLTALDNNKDSLMTYSNNIETKYGTILNSAENIKPEDILTLIKLESGELDLLIGGPPCRGFSLANQQSRTKSNNFNNLIYRYLEFIKTIKPKMFVLENVIGLLNFMDGMIFNDITNRIRKFNYILNKKIFNCESYGIPQKRERIIIIGTRRRKKISINIKKQKKIPVKRAIDDLPDLPNGNRDDPLKYKKDSNLSSYQKEMRRTNDSERVSNNLVTKNTDDVIQRYQHIPQGGNWRDIPRKLMKNYSNLENCHSSIYHRLNPEKPSITICNFRKNMIIHPYQDRGLSVREAARIQSFPDDFVFEGGIASQQQQVANAVPPKLSYFIANEILKYFNN